MGTVLAAHAGGRIAAQGHDMADAGVPVGAGDVVDLALRRRHAGEVGGGVDAGFLLEAGPGLVGAPAGGAPPRARFPRKGGAAAASGALWRPPRAPPPPPA